MKKLLLSSLCFVMATLAHAQISFSLTTPPCNNDGVFSATVTSPLTPPLTVVYTTYGTAGTTYTHTGVTSLIDVFTSYSGGQVQVIATDGSGATAYGFYGGAPPFTYSVTPTSAVCPGLGSVTASVSGGTAPYTYQWYDRTTSVVVGTTNPLSVPSGDYGVGITDAAGCVYGSMYERFDTGQVRTYPVFSVTTTPATANCTNGTISTTVTGATPPLSYSWSNGATTPNIIGLVMGAYNVTITDGLGCSGNYFAYVPQAITITSPVVATPATCTASDGGVVTFGSGGTPPYSYVWSNGSTMATQTGLPAGYYRVAVTDANGCIGSGGASVSVSTPIVVSYSTTPTLCTAPTGSATLIISGGTAPYTTSWFTAPPQTGISAVGLPQGNHSFQVVDAAGCIQTGAATVPPINVIYASFLNTPSICTLATGSIVPTVSGGVTPYSYAWSTGSTASSLSSVSTGLYHVDITDAMGCKAKFSQYLPFSSTLGLSLSSSQTSCYFVNDGTITASPTGGTPPYSYAWTGGGSTSTIIGLPARIPYYVRVTDALGCYADDRTVLGSDTLSSCYCTIAGVVYDDANGNCIQDVGEAGIENIQIGISGRGYTYTDATGHYSYKVPSGTYTVSETVKAFYPLSACQLNNISVTSVAGTGCVIPVDFANTVSTIHDMRIATWDYIPAVPGHTYTQIVVVGNNGTIPEPTIFSSYKADGQLFAPSFIPSGLYTGSSYYYNTLGSFPTLNPAQRQSFLLNYTVPTSIPLGTNVVFKDTVTIDTPVTNWLTDYTPWNNVNYLNTTVVSSFDPNFKEVSPKGVGALGIITPADTVLEYMVHFQNTGTYRAENIVVVDTLDDNLDWTTVSPTYATAQYRASVEMSGGKKVLTFTFNNINLPPVTTEPVASNGMFSYTIKTKRALPLGTQFKNSASIYFDYNAPIKTNQTLNTIGSTTPPTVTSSISVAANSFVIYPNPANNSFSAVINTEIAGSADMNVTDLAGRTVISKQINVLKGNQTISLDASKLSSGVYFVNFNQNGKSQTQKLVIVKS